VVRGVIGIVASVSAFIFASPGSVESSSVCRTQGSVQSKHKLIGKSLPVKINSRLRCSHLPKFVPVRTLQQQAHLAPRNGWPCRVAYHDEETCSCVTSSGRGIVLVVQSSLSISWQSSCKRWYIVVSLCAAAASRHFPQVTLGRATCSD
jgi:hypothetical protein